MRGPGSWLYFAHTGKGLHAYGTAANTITGVQFENFGMFRDQPTPGPGWAPNDHEPDIYTEYCGVEARDLMFLNATRGMRCDMGNYGKFTGRNIQGHFFKYGLYLDKQYDLPILDGFRAWTFWADDDDVHAYTKANCDAIYLQRVDNGLFTNVFTIAMRAGLRIGKSAASGAYPGGTAQKVRLTNCDFDIGKYGIWIDTTVDTGAFLQFVNATMQGDNINGSVGVHVEGSNSRLDFVNTDIRLTDINAVRVLGTGNQLRFDGALYIDEFNNGGASFPAVEASNGNTIIITQEPTITNDGGTGGAYSTTGTIKSPGWRIWTPTISATSGTITSYAINRSLFRRTEGGCEIELDFTITNNGTGAGQIIVTLPFASVGVITLNGYITTGGAGQFFGAGGAGTTQIQLVKADGSTYPGGTGWRLRIQGGYSA